MPLLMPGQPHFLDLAIPFGLCCVHCCVLLSRRSWTAKTASRSREGRGGALPPLPHCRAKGGVHRPSGLAHLSRFARRCAVQTHGITDNTPEKKGDLFAMSVLISRC